MKNLYLKIYLIALLVLACAGGVPTAQAATAPQITMLTPIGTGLKTPVRLATDPSGFIYVADPRAGGIVKLAPDGSRAIDLSGAPVIVTTVASPLGVAVKSNGDLLISQGTTVSLHTMVKPSEGTPTAPAYSYSKQPVATLQPAGGFQLANGITVAADGTIFIVDSLANKVYRFNGTTNSLIDSFGSKGAELGQFDIPTAIAYEKASNQVAVVDVVNGRIQFFTTAGVYVRHIGSRGTDLNASESGGDAVYFNYPQGVAFEYSKSTPATLNRMYVVDTYQSRVQVIDPAGSGQRLRYIGTFGITSSGVATPTTTASAFKLTQPADVLFDPLNSRLLVANGFGNLVLFGVDAGTNPLPVSTTPAVTYVTPASITRTGTFTVTGTTDRPAIVTLDTTQGSASPACTATFSDTTNWSCTVTIPENQQNVAISYWVKARPVAVNGQSAVAISPFSVSYISGAPQLTVNSYVTPTASDTITLSGTSDATSLKICPANSFVSGSCTTTELSAANPLNWSVTLPLPSQSNVFHITAGATTQDVTIEKIIITPAMLATGSTVTTPVAHVGGMVNGVSTVQVVLNSAAQPLIIPVTSGQFSTAVTLKNGSNSLIVTTKDAAGTSLSSPPTFTYTFDPAAPAVAITSASVGAIPVQDGGSIPRSSLTLSGTATAGTNLTLSIDGGTATALTNNAGAWTTSPAIDTTAFTLAQHTFTVSATGNSKTSAVNNTYTVVAAKVPEVTVRVTDNPVGQAPAVTYTTDTATNLTTVYVSGSAATNDGTNPTVAVGVSLNGTALPVAFNASNTPDGLTGLAAWSYMVSTPVDFTTEGQQTFVVTAFAADGSSSSVTRTLIFSQTPPQLVGSVTPNGNNFDVTVGSGITRVCVGTCQGVNDLTASATTAANGSTTYTVTQTQLATLTFYDAAGNSSRNGRILGGSGEPTVADVVMALRIAVHATNASTDALLHGDIAPLTNPVTLSNGMVKYTVNPDGIIDMNDARALFYRAIGLATW